MSRRRTTSGALALLALFASCNKEEPTSPKREATMPPTQEAAPPTRPSNDAGPPPTQNTGEMAPWHLAGAWMLAPIDDALAMELRVCGDGSIRGNLHERGQFSSKQILEVSAATASSVVITAFANLEALDAKQSKWSLRMEPTLRGARWAGTLRRAEESEKPIVLTRWSASDIQVPPSDAVETALQRWQQSHPPPERLKICVSESGTPYPETGLGGEREWWVRIPRAPREDGRRSRPSSLTIAVGTKSGAARGPFGR